MPEDEIKAETGVCINMESGRADEAGKLFICRLPGLRPGVFGYILHMV